MSEIINFPIQLIQRAEQDEYEMFIVWLMESLETALDYDLKEYGDDLTNSIITCFDIMKVFGFCKYHSQEYDYSTDFRDLLWERKEKSAKDIEIESIQAEMDKLSKRLDELKETH